MKTQPTNYRTSERSQTPTRTFLYRFKHSGVNYFYTNLDADVVVTGGPVADMSDPQTFTSAPVGHTNTEESLDSVPRAVTVALGATDVQLRQYFLTVPPQPIEVQIWRVSSSALPSVAYGSDVVPVFRGLVSAVGFDDMQINAACETQLAQEDRQIPRFHYQKLCNHMLYGPDCGLDKTLFQVSKTIDALNHASSYVDFIFSTINIDSPARSHTITAQTFEGGYFTDTHGNVVTVTAGELLAGSRVRLWCNFLPKTLNAGDTVTLQMGCIHVKRVCNDNFWNLPRFGGTPYIPTNNPAVDGIGGT